ncbi:MAG: flagellar protein export ATPase FliI [Chromatiales bacterium]|jgi:flagellum-specific ATP synthase|nr:flagellar protein export ATPase FliI [Chromatiales bacterium]MDG2040898.1 flagellar protein export ATPase FliI [Ilumatobacter sp.]
MRDPDAGTSARTRHWARRLSAATAAVRHGSSLRPNGYLTRVAGITLEAVGCRVPLGGRCFIENAAGMDVEAEVVGFSDEKLFLMPVDDMHGILPHARVRPTDISSHVKVGEALLGRVIDGNGVPLDDVGPLRTTGVVPLAGRGRNPLHRQPIDEPLDVGVRSINALLTVGRGQRIGLFASSGVGKSVLLGMMTRYTNADVVVVGLIGERGREVQEFISTNLGPEGLARSVVVVAPADSLPLMRIHGAALATSVAEYFRDRGQRVLLLMDSLTRYAQAQREIGLAIGEPPATKGYPPSVFARLPSLVERAGTGAVGSGSITAVYTVLTEGDPDMDPVADSARAILDGHVVLSRTLAEAGIFPAVDIEASISRVMMQVVDGEHTEAAQRFRQVYSAYERNRDLVNVGAYVRGASSEVDLAVDRHGSLIEFLRQGIGERVAMADSVRALKALRTTLTPATEAYVGLDGQT